MKKYNVVITETLQRKVEIEASSPDDAYDIAEGMIKRCEIVLDADDFEGRSIEVVPIRFM